MHPYIANTCYKISKRFYVSSPIELEIAVQLSNEDIHLMEFYLQNTRFLYLEFNKILTSRLKICNEGFGQPLSFDNFCLEFNQYYYKDFIYIKPKYTKNICMRVSTKDTWMSLCKKNIIVLRPTINYLVSLQTLQLCCNYLTFLPDEICELKNLSRLIIAKNRIEHLPQNIGMLRNLRELNVSGNMLKSLPHSFTSLRQLTFLILNDNKIEELSHELSGCISLKYLFVARNKIKYIGAELMLLPFLRIIDYQNNPIESRDSIHKPEKNMTLQEICARKILNCKTRVSKDLSSCSKEFLLGVKECFFCGGAFFNSWHEVNLCRVINEAPVTFRAKLCKLHFRDQTEYISKLFYLSDQRIGFHLCNENYPRVSELFILTSYLPNKLKEIQKYLKKEESLNEVPLFTLIDGYDLIDNNYVKNAEKLLKISFKDEFRYSEQM